MVEEHPDGHSHKGEERQQEKMERQERNRPLELVDELVDDHERSQNDGRPDEQQAAQCQPKLHLLLLSLAWGRGPCLSTDRHDATWRSPVQPKHPYPPECVEGVFSEVLVASVQLL
jgi:hypothetical protein